MARYKNVGTMPLLVGESGPGKPSPKEYQPGVEFDAVLSPEQEAFWFKTLSIVRLVDPPVERRTPRVKEE